MPVYKTWLMLGGAVALTVLSLTVVEAKSSPRR